MQPQVYHYGPRKKKRERKRNNEVCKVSEVNERSEQSECSEERNPSVIFEKEEYEY